MMRPKHRGEKVTWEDYNELFQALDKVLNLSVAPPLSMTAAGRGKQISLIKGNRKWLGLIQSTGPQGSEDDYSDERYWVARAYMVGSTGGSDPTDTVQNSHATDNIAFYVYPTDSNLSLIITATSLAELVDQTHTLAVNTPVLIEEETDIGTPSQVRYTFSMGGGGLPTPQYQYMVLQGVSQNQAGWGYVLAHAM